MAPVPSHRGHLWTLGCDADDPQRIAAFWALALGYVKESGFDEPDNASIVDPDGQGPAIGFLKVPEGKIAEPRTGRRMHLDVMPTGGLATRRSGD